MQATTSDAWNDVITEHMSGLLAGRASWPG